MIGIVGARRFRLVNALDASAWAVPATPSVACIVPVRVMVPEPVIEVPGERPRSPPRVVAPVLVTVEAPSTAKLPALPRKESA